MLEASIFNSSLINNDDTFSISSQALFTHNSKVILFIEFDEAVTLELEHGCSVDDGVTSIGGPRHGVVGPDVGGHHLLQPLALLGTQDVGVGQADRLEHVGGILGVPSIQSIQIVR